MILPLIQHWAKSTAQVPSEVVTPSQFRTAAGPVVLASEFGFGVPWEEIRNRKWHTVVVLPQRIPGLPKDIPVFDAGHDFAPLTAAARLLGASPARKSAGKATPAATPQAGEAATGETAACAIDVTQVATPSNGVSAPGGEQLRAKQVPTLADSDLFGYIVAALVGAAVTTALWGHIIPGVLVGVLMVILLVAGDKILGKGIPRAPS